MQDGIYGVMPSFHLGQDDDCGTRGAWIPTLSDVQVAATLGKWFGADVAAGELLQVFPELVHFAGQEDLGFMAPV